MLQKTDDCAKRRLTGDAELRVAVEFLMSHGIADDDIAVRLCRHYYVDIDALNQVLATISREEGREAAESSWRRVA